jgi:hypothetical protein
VLVELDLDNFIAANTPLLTSAEAMSDEPVNSGVAVAVYITNLRTGVVTKHYADAVSTPERLFKYTPTEDFANGGYSITAAVEIIDRKATPARGIAGLSEKTTLTVADIDDYQYVRQLYRAILRREATGGEELSYVQALRAGTMNYRSVETSIWNSAEHRKIQVNDLFRGLLGRDADPQGLETYWPMLQGTRNGEQIVNAMLTEEQLALTLLNSAEYRNRFGNNVDFVRGLYQSVLGRNADAPGEAAWVGQLNAGTLSKDQVVQYFLASEEFNHRVIDTYYRQLLGRRSDRIGREVYSTQLTATTLSFRTLALELLSSEELYSRL